MDNNFLLSLYQDDWVRKYVLTFKCGLGLGLVYDHALTFGKEVEFIWQPRWTFTKAIFLINRYGNLICQTILQIAKLIGVPNHSAESCDLPAGFTAAYMVLAMESIHILVLLRAWAIWCCDRWVAAMLIGSYSIYLLFYFVKAIFSTMSMTTLTFKYPNLPDICVTVIPQKMWMLCLANICQDTAVFVITMTSLWRHWRTTKYLYPTSPLCCLVRDAVIFYIAGVSLQAFGAVVCILYSSNPKNVLFRTFALNLFSIAGQRFVLNLHGFAVRTYGSRTLSAEVDRQLQMLSATEPLEWWSTGISPGQSDGCRASIIQLRTISTDK